MKLLSPAKEAAKETLRALGYGAAVLGIALGLAVGFNPAAVAQLVGFVLPNGTTVAGHLLAANGINNGAVMPPPVCTTCTLTAQSTDFAGQLTTAGTSGVVLTFGTAFVTLPWCVVKDNTTAADQLVTYTKTALTFGTTGGTDIINYICIGQPGN